MSGQIRSDSRISDLVDVLCDPIEYVSGIVSNFVSHGYDRETSAIRIGITGRGIFPNYKIEEPSVPITITVRSRRFDMISTPARTFNGRNHREMTELDDQEWRDENWSATKMSFAELDAVFSELLQNRKKSSRYL